VIYLIEHDALDNQKGALTKKRISEYIDGKITHNPAKMFDVKNINTTKTVSLQGINQDSESVER